jgi:hypothetical protein
MFENGVVVSTLELQRVVSFFNRSRNRMQMIRFRYISRIFVDQEIFVRYYRVFS